MLTEIFRRYHCVGQDLPIVNAGVAVGPARVLRQICRAMIAEGKASGEKDDQRVLNTLVAKHVHDPKTGICVGLMEGLHCHCERSLWGPLHHLYTNVPKINNGPMQFTAAQSETVHPRCDVRIGTHTTRVFVVHGIWSTHLGSVCEALHIQAPPKADLRKRKISQLDSRLYVDTSRSLAALTAVCGAVALVKMAFESEILVPMP